MSTVVDERVVEMRFNNKDFERNVQTSMSTIEKLKQKLNFKGVSKGVSEINGSMKKVDTSGLGRGIDIINVKFSAMQAAGIRAITNITDSVMSAGTKIASALTIDPIRDGMAEYETQMNAVQTILANTQKEGTDVKRVNAALNELNTYADKTIYNFTEMTRNIGTFTAAGVKLDTSVSAIKGIANLAAVSGSTSLQASTTMYQLSQAIASGAVKLQDWNSVVNAGMGGQVFQDALTRTSEHLQTGAKAAIEAEGSFRESLKDGWLTTEVLTQTLDQFATAADTQKEYEAAVKKFIDQGYGKEEATQMADMAKTAGEAATKVKTFSQLINTLKEAMGSGWTESWRLIIGDFEEAREMWSNVSDVFSAIINRTSKFRNDILDSALGRGFTDLAERINGVTEPVQNAISAVEELDSIVNDVILGKFGNGQTRFDALAEAGYNYCVVQNKVNETLGSTFRYTEEQIAAQDEVIGKTTTETGVTGELTDEKKKLIKEIANLSEEEMRAKGYTEDQINAFKDLKNIAEKLGIPLNDFIDNMDQINGRWLLLHSFENIGEGIAKVFKTIASAYTETFGELTVDDLADKLFDAIAAFHKFTSSLIMSDESADKLKRTFKGLFAILDIVTSFINGGAKLAIKGVSSVLDAFDLDILDVTAGIGDAVVAFKDFLFSNDLIDKGFENFGNGVKMVIEYISNLIKVVGDIPEVQQFFENVKNIDYAKLGSDAMTQLKNGFEKGAANLPSAIREIAKNIFFAITDAFAVEVKGESFGDIGSKAIGSMVDEVTTNSDATIRTVKEKGSAIVASFEDFKNNVSTAWTIAMTGIANAIKTGVTSAKEVLSGVDWNKVIAVGGITAAFVGTLKTVNKITDTIDKFAAPFESAGKLLESASAFVKKCTESIDAIVKSFSKKLKAEAFKTKAQGIKEIAIAIGILAAAVYALTQLDTEKMWISVGVIATLAGILIALAFAMNKLSGASASIDENGLNLKGLKTGLVGIGVALLLMAATVKIIGGMNVDEAKQGFLGLAGLVLAIAVVLGAFGIFVKGKSAQNIDKAGKMMRKMAMALMLMAIATKLIGTLSYEDMFKGVTFMSAFTLFTLALTAISNSAGRNVDKFSSAMVKMAIAMGLMVGVCKLAGKLSALEMIKGAAFAAGFAVFVGLLGLVTRKKQGTEIAKLSGLLISISVAMALMVGVTKLIGTLSAGELVKGVAFAAGFLVFVAALKAITTMQSGSSIAKMSALLISMSVSMALMVGVMKLVGLLSVGDIVKGGVAIAAFGVLMIAMIKAVKRVGPSAPKMATTLLAMSAAIGIMAGVAILLSLLDIQSLAKGIVAVGLLGAVLAAMIWATRGASECMKNIIVMSVAVGIMASAVALLSFLDTKSLIGATACLSALMLAFAVMAKASNSAGGSLESMLMMTLIVGALAGICVLMASLPLEASITTCASLSILMIAFSASLLLVSKAGDAAIDAWKGVLMMVGVMAVLVGLLWAIQALDIQASLTTTVALSVLLLALSGACLLLSKVGDVSNNAVVGAAKLMAIVGIAALIFGAIGGLIGQLPNAEEFLDKGIPILEKLGYGLGAFFGNIIGGFTSGVTSGLPEIGANLTSFMDNMQGFLNGVSAIDPSALTGVKTLADTVLEITQASFLDQIMGIIPFFEDNPIESLVDSIKQFVTGLIDISETLNSFDDVKADKLTAIANIGKAFAELQNSVGKTNGLVQAIGGISDLGGFGVQIRQYAVNFNRAAYAVSNISDTDIDNLSSIASIGEAFAKLQESVEPTDGLVQKLEGHKDLGEFGTEISSYASNFKTAADAVIDLPDEGIDNLEGIVTIGEAFSKLQDTVDATDGLAQILSGKSDLGKFGEDIKKYASGIKSASESLTGENAIDKEAINNALDIGTLLSELQNALPEENWFDGKLNLSEFSTRIKDFGSAVGTFGSDVADVDTSQMKGAIEVAKSLKTFGEELADFDTTGISYFVNGGAGGASVSDVGNELNAYYASVSSTDTQKISDSVDAGTKLADFISSLSSLDTSGAESFKSAVATLGSTRVEGAADSLTTAADQLTATGGNIMSSLSQGISDKSSEVFSATTGIVTGMNLAITQQASLFVAAGTLLMLKLVEGIKSQNTSVSSAASTTAQSGADGVNSCYYSFYTSGTYLGTGLVNGINDQKQAVYNAGYELGKKAVEGERAGQDSASPSKATEQSGIWLGEGLIIGISRMERKVSKAGAGMGESVTSSLSSVISKVGNAIEHSDDYTPTIRPVVDLTDVQAGASMVGGMFSGVTFDANTNMKAVSTSMSYRQNGFSDDVVDAINKLGKKLGNTGNNSYNIGGITYEEGSDVADAIKTLSRVATVNRRR